MERTVLARLLQQVKPTEWRVTKVDQGIPNDELHQKQLTTFYRRDTFTSREAYFIAPILELSILNNATLRYPSRIHVTGKAAPATNVSALSPHLSQIEKEIIETK